MPALPRRSGGRQGILFQRGNVPTASFHQEKILKYPDGQIFDVITNGQGLMAGYAGRSLLRTGGRSSPTCESFSASGWHAPRPRRGQAAEGDSRMNGVMNRKLLFVLGPVTGLVMFAAVVLIATFLTNREYKGLTGLLPRS